MRTLIAITAIVLASAFSPVHAQAAWPNKPITLVVPFPPGGGTDAFARPLSVQLSKQLGRQVIIDNRGGAGGTVGASIAAKAAPDGYTFFIGAVHHTIAPGFYKLDYNLETDFAPLTIIANPPQVIVVNPNRVKAENFQDFLSYARKNPGKLNFGSAGNGYFASPRWGIVQDSKQDVHHSHSIPGRWPCAERLDRRQCRHDVRRHGFIGAAHSIGPDSAARAGGAEALTGVSEFADHGRSRLSRLRCLDLVRNLGHQGHTEGNP